MAQCFIKGYYTTSVYSLSNISKFYSPNPVIIRNEREVKLNRANAMSLGIPAGGSLCIVSYTVSEVLDSYLVNVNGFIAHGETKNAFGQNFILKETDDRLGIVSDVATVYDAHVLDRTAETFYDVPNQPIPRSQPAPVQEEEKKPAPAAASAPVGREENAKVKPSQIVTPTTEVKEEARAPAPAPASAPAPAPASDHTPAPAPASVPDATPAPTADSTATSERNRTYRGNKGGGNRRKGFQRQNGPWRWTSDEK
jgi:hypothetical protein